MGIGTRPAVLLWVMGLGLSCVHVILWNARVCIIDFIAHQAVCASLNCHLNCLFYRTTFYKVQSLLMWSFCLHTNTRCMIQTCKSHTSMHESTGMGMVVRYIGMGWRWKNFVGMGGNGVDFHYRVTLESTHTCFWKILENDFSARLFQIFSIVLWGSTIDTTPIQWSSDHNLIRKQLFNW